MKELAPSLQEAPQARDSRISALAFVQDSASENTVRHCFADLGMADAEVRHGTIDSAIRALPRQKRPRMLIVDVSGVDDPVLRLNQLVDVCDPSTDVVMLGDRNDIVLYRDLKAAGVAEYFFKPVASDILMRALNGVLTGHPETGSARTGKLIVVMGVRGGVGTTTLAVNSAWYLAEVLQRRVALLDLDLQTGDSALQLDVTPGPALREALEHPERVDDLFLARGVVRVTPRLDLLASLEPLGDLVMPDEQAALDLIGKLLQRYRYVFVDVPVETAIKFNELLHMPGTVILVSDASLIATRDVLRWRDKVGANSPKRSILHVLNKRGGEGSLPEKEFIDVVGQPPDVIMRYDRNVARTSSLGVKTMQNCTTIRRAMGTLALHLTGDSSVSRRPLWRRVFR